MSGLGAQAERAAKAARAVLRQRRLQAGEAGWGAPVVPAPILPDRPGQPRRVAVVGTGAHGTEMATAVTEVVGAELVGLADLNRERLDALADRLGVPSERRFDDAAAMFASGPIDLAVVATTAPSHAALGRLALDAGIRRLLVEKPIDNSYAAAAALVAAADAAGATLAIDHFRHWQPDTRAMLEVVRSGQLGPIRIVTALIGAGELAMQASHHIDWARTVIGAEPVEVSAHLRSPVGPNRRGADIEDPTGHLVVRFANGARAFIDVGDDLPRGDGIVTIRGDLGYVQAEENRGVWTMRAESGRTWTFPYAVSLRPLDVSRVVIHGVLTEERPASSGADALVALDVVLGALHSQADGGRAVALPLTDEQRALPTRFA